MSDLDTIPTVEGWIEIIGGKRFDIGNPDPDSIYPEDIAHSLSRLCRYNGHSTRHYSVAEHCILMADYLEHQGFGPCACLTALHHDDAEYIMGDLARPVKHTLPAFKMFERKLERIIARRFKLMWPLPDYIKEIDTRILIDERQAVMVDSGLDWGLGHLEPLGVRLMSIRGHFPSLVKRSRLKRHYKWSKRIA